MRVAVASLSLLSFFLLSCEKPEPAKPIGKPKRIDSPLGLPSLVLPSNNLPTEATIALGEKLFSSPILSVDRSRSCASCHRPDHAFAEELPVSSGVQRRKGRRNAPTVLNAAFQSLQFHDGRAASLEHQASGPILNELEMAHNEKALLEVLNTDQEWTRLFVQAFGPGKITLEKITMALASFERTLLSGNSPFDRFYFGGDQQALSPEAQRGLEVFRRESKGNCATCHRIDEKHALFSDGRFHNLGAGMNPQGELTDLGRYEVTKAEVDKGAFRTPTLRNIARTAPYMHDGSLKSLDEVIAFYIAGGNANPHLDPEMKPLRLTRQDRLDLRAFLESLTGDDQP